MANYCFTNIKIFDQDKDKLRSLYKMIEKVTVKNKRLSQLVSETGIGTVDTGKPTDIYCRGEIEDFELKENYLSIDQNSAYYPALKLWMKIQEDYIPKGTLIFNSSDDEDWYTNDASLMDKYIVDQMDDIEGFDDYINETDMEGKDLIRLLQRLLNTKEGNLNHLLNKYESSELSDVLKITRWQYANPSDFS